MPLSRLRRISSAVTLWLLCSVLATSAYEVPVTDKDYLRQTCSGMWGGDSAYINVTFDSTSQGQLAMVVYEWTDSDYLGKVTNPEEILPQKTFVCTTPALMGGFCDRSQLGRFIVDLPEGKSVNETSFWSARVDLSSDHAGNGSASAFWDNPDGNPDVPPSNYTSPFRTRELSLRQENHSPEGTYQYKGPIQYFVRKTGYYCVAIVPFTLQNDESPETSDTHAAFKGQIFFHNTFEGKLPATDYPKVNFYFVMFLLYAIFAAAWGWMCYRHMNDLLPIQYYLSSLVGLLVIEMVANLAYYRYLNAHGKGAAATAFLIVVAILDAGRNSLSFFMLLVVSLGLSVVRESLGRTMLKCQVLGVAHFIFGILYAVGIVELELESTSALVLLLFVIPLAFTLSGFLLWIMYALNATITQLRARKQRYKLSMFEKLNKILILIVVVIAIFFVVSSLSFSGRLAEAMSDEIAQDEEDAEDYDLEALESRTRAREDDDDDNATLVGDRRGGPAPLHDDQVVFEIGDEDAGSDDEDDSKKGRIKLQSSENLPGEVGERQGLMGNGSQRDRSD